MCPSEGALGRNNLDWPGFALTRHCSHCVAHLAHGDFDSRQSLGLIGAIGLGYQSLHLLLRPRWSETWWRAASVRAALLGLRGRRVEGILGRGAGPAPDDLRL